MFSLFHNLSLYLEKKKNLQCVPTVIEFSKAYCSVFSEHAFLLNQSR